MKYINVNITFSKGKWKYELMPLNWKIFDWIWEVHVIVLWKTQTTTRKFLSDNSILTDTLYDGMSNKKFFHVYSLGLKQKYELPTFFSEVLKKKLLTKPTNIRNYGEKIHGMQTFCRVRLYVLLSSVFGFVWNKNTAIEVRLFDIFWRKQDCLFFKIVIYMNKNIFKYVVESIYYQ